KTRRHNISQSAPKPEPQRVQAGSKLRATKFLAVIAVLLVIVIGLVFYLRPVKKVVHKPANPPAEIPTASTAADSRVHYDLVYDPNPLSLEGGAAPSFSAVYEGWGCYETVVVTVYLKSPGSQPLKKTFNM